MLSKPVEFEMEMEMDEDFLYNESQKIRKF